MKIGILLTGLAPPELDGGPEAYPTMFMQLLDGHGFTFETFVVVNGQFPPSAEACDGWLITGSKHGAYEDLPWIAPLEELIREIYATGHPMIGVCFGHQIIAQALGGKVEKFDGGWAVGRAEYEIEGQKIALNAWHQDQVTELPDGAKVIGSNDFCANAALIYDNRILTVQPHPEFTAEVIDVLMQHRAKGVVPEPLLAEAATQLSEPTQSAAFADRMAAFLQRAEKDE